MVCRDTLRLFPGVRGVEEMFRPYLEIFLSSGVPTEDEMDI